jgi:hypothetical protein
MISCFSVVALSTIKTFVWNNHHITKRIQKIMTIVFAGKMPLVYYIDDPYYTVEVCDATKDDVSINCSLTKILIVIIVLSKWRIIRKQKRKLFFLT